MKKSTMVYCILIGAVLIGAFLIAYQHITKEAKQTIVEPPHDYKFQDDDYALYGIADPHKTNPRLLDYHFTLYKNHEQLNETLTFRCDTRLSTFDTHNFPEWWANGDIDCVLTDTAAIIQVGVIKLELDFKMGNVQYTREYRKEMLVDLLTANKSGDKQIFQICYDTPDVDTLSNDIVLYNAKTEQIHYMINGNYLKQIQFDNKDRIFAATLDGLRCFDSETGRRIDPPFAQFAHYRNCDFVDLIYDNENEVHILAWAEKHNENRPLQDELYTMKVILIASDNETLMDFDTEYKIPDTELSSPLWPSLTLDDTSLEFSGYSEDGSERVFLSISKPKYLESIHDYTFQSGAYTLYCREFPTEKAGIEYRFSLYQGSERIGNVLTFQSDGITTYHYDRWWMTGMVDGVLSDATATVRVGIFTIELDFRQNYIKCTRDYKKEMLGDLLASNQTGDKQIYNIVYDETFHSEESAIGDIVLYDTKTAQIHYLLDGFPDQIVFDHQNNILACYTGGVFCFDADTYLRKELPFAFLHTTDSYDFVDFLYDSKNERYLIAWAEHHQRGEMIPEEATTIEGVPNMNVSIFSADGTLLMEYDTKHIIPSFKVFQDQHWPRLRLDDSGLALAASFLDGRKRTFLSVPLSDYLKLGL